MPVNLEQEKSNPCLKEQEMTYKCLNENNYSRERCTLFYKNYRNCKDFWGKVQSDRRRNGIRPIMPPVSERAQIKTDYQSQES